ncbi:MAG: signal peptide peptidase SppA [Planctomycetes bacterium]|nr:signal peptide peptidase SppA [Planctomycetota bacterium]
MFAHSARISTSALIPTAALIALVAGCMPTGSFKITAMPEDQSLREQIVYKDPKWISERIAIIDISGVLMNGREMGLLSEGEHIVSLIVEKLDKAAKDDRVKAVVLRINSPGGTVTASDTIYEEILAFKRKTGKPVVAFFQDVAASGGYYLACAADEIMAQRSTVTGSIGVIMQMVDVSGGMNKLGITSDAITSGKFKDTGSPFRKMRAEERALFQDMVNSFYNQFVDAVDAGRPKLDREQVVKLADGRVYTAAQALAAGLVDRVGTIHDAIEVARGRAGLKAAHVVLYRRPLDWSSNVYAKSLVTGGSVMNLINIEVPFDFTIRPRFLYIWDSQ